MTKVSLVIITDGRLGYLEQTLFSLNNNVKYPFFEKLIINDCEDPAFIKSVNNLSNVYGLTPIHHEKKRGFAGSYDTAFKSVSRETDFVFFCEDDFTFNEDIDLGKMIFILNYNRNLVQCSLKRQAWGHEEERAGGFIEMWPELYEDKRFSDISWTEHRQFFTTNPSLVPYWIIENGWPLVPKSEKVMTDNLFKNPNYRSSILGSRFEKPKVQHIGNNRSGIGY